MKSLRAFALKLPDCDEGIACKGTALESASYKVRKKAFLFVRRACVMLKLHDSLSAAKKLAAREPDRYRVGSSGWVQVTHGDELPLQTDVLEGWIEESYRLMRPAEKRPAAMKKERHKGRTRRK